MAENTQSTPSADLAAKAAATHDVTDPVTGIKITIRKPSVLAQYDLIETLGGERSANATYVQMALPIIYVVAINGEPVVQPRKFAEVRALLQRLGDEGIAAVAGGIALHFGAQISSEEAAATVKK